jgi:hypothetical protein
VRGFFGDWPGYSCGGAHRSGLYLELSLPHTNLLGGRLTRTSCRYLSNPNAATPLGVPTYTLPFTMVGTMNLFPAPNWSRPFAA